MAEQSPTKLWAAVGEQQIYIEPCDLNKTNEDLVACLRLSPVCTKHLTHEELQTEWVIIIVCIVAILGCIDQ